MEDGNGGSDDRLARIRMAPWTLSQVSEHNGKESCWVIVHGKVYDVTSFLPDHPGGVKAILDYAGKDASEPYDLVHPPDTLDKHLDKQYHLGPLSEQASDQLTAQKADRKLTKDELRVQEAKQNKPPIQRILSLHDMERVAKAVLPHKAFAYYSAGSDEEMSLQRNHDAFRSFFFQARVLRRVNNCDPSTSILGQPSSLPIFVSGAALAKLGHPLGEVNITRGAGHTGIIQMVSSNSSVSFQDIAKARLHKKQPLFFQLYKSANDEIAEKRVREVEACGYNAIFLTADAVVSSNKEFDIRAPWVVEDLENDGKVAQKVGLEPEDDTKLESEQVDLMGTAGSRISGDDRDMTWEKTIPWLRKTTKLPIVIKGIQSVADAVLAAEAGVDGILISNHGGRQLDYSMPSLEVLYQLRCERPDVFDKVQVFMDGGVRRGTDVLKALCLGATAVGLGRPFLYAQSAYGAQGVVKAVRILEREIITDMRLLGAATVKDLVPDMVKRLEYSGGVKSRL